MKVFGLDFKNNMLQSINVTIAANPKRCNIPNPGPLDQEPGLEKGLPLLLHESFYSG